MTTQPLVQRHRERVLQDQLQAQIEAGTGNGVIGWTSALSFLKETTPNLPAKASRTGHLQVLVQSDAAKGVVGLIEGLARVNRQAFEQLQRDWESHGQVTPAPTLAMLAQAAAEKVAKLWEAGLPDPVKTRGYKLMLVYGGEYAWDCSKAIFGADPRSLGPEDFPDWPKALARAPFRVVHADESLPFLDLAIPGWVDATKKIDAVREAELLRKAAPQNAYTWVREFVVTTPGGREERADFTLFVHGLPILWVEVKVPERGVAAAAQDFLDKQTYQTAPLRLLVDGQEAILTAASEGRLEKWYVNANPIGHGTGMPVADHESEPGGGIKAAQAYLIGQLLTRPERLEFLIRRASAFNSRGDFVVARSQQYQALAHFWRDLLWAAAAGQDISDRLVRHTQRTGKTHTMLRAIRLGLSARGKVDSAFDLALLMVGETNIIKQIASELLNNQAGLLDTPIAIDHAKDRKDFRKALAAQSSAPGTKRVILANTQKLDSLDNQKMDGKSLSKILAETGVSSGSKSIKALVVLDESHLSQHGGMADMRQLLLPDATHLLLTATPKQEMSSYYLINSEEQILDDFSYFQAKEAGIVVSVLFERQESQASINPLHLEELVQELGKPVSEKEAMDLIDGDEDVDDLIVDRKHRRAVTRTFMDKLDRDMLPGRLDAIVNRLDSIEQTLLDENGQRRFVPKCVVFCNTVGQAKAGIEFVQQRNRQEAHGGQVLDKDLNVYRGRRFGMDVSNFGKGDDNHFSKLNPGVANPDDIKNRFKTDEADQRIDILFVVGKYTKGYDNANLCLVTLMRRIREPSLINQIFTRPATKRDGKACGVCLDLTLGNTNVESWRASVALYDKKSAGNFFDQSGVAHLLAQVREHLEGAAKTIAPTWTDENLGVAGTLGWAIDRLNAGGLGAATDFVHHMSLACQVVEKLPDAATLHPLRMPLLGAKFILSQVRSIFPELDQVDHRKNGLTVDILDAETIGHKIDGALAVLNVTSLSSFLNLTHLGIQEVDADSGNGSASQALLARRTQTSVDNSVAAAKAILGASYPKNPAEEEDGNPQSQDDGEDPTSALRRALEVALERLLGQTKGGVAELDTHAKRQAAKEAVALVQQETQKLRHTNGQSDFTFLLTSELHKAFEHRWELLGLPEEGKALFHPLIQVAGEQWGSDFDRWRTRCGTYARSLDPASLVKQWLSEEHLLGASLVEWTSSCMEKHPAWQAQFTAWASAHREISHLVRAAMGVNREAEPTRELPGLLNEAAAEAARSLSVIEASLAWNKVAQSDGT